MKRYAPLLIALLCLSTPQARAQIVSAENKIASVTVDGNTAGSSAGTIIYINSKDCADNVKIEFGLQSLNSPQFLEVWRSTSDAACHDAMGRTVSGTGTTAAAGCTQIGTAKQSPGSKVALTFTSLELFSSDKKACDQRGTPKIYFVPLMTATATGATTGVSAGLGMPNYVTFTVDVDAPPAPTKLSASDGENEIGVSWKSDDTSNTADGFTVYYDPNNISKSESPCSSDILVAGEAVDDDSALETGSASAGATKATTAPDAVGLDIGEQIPVAVAARDKAGNESVLSEVVCIKRVATDGFYKRYEQEGGKGLEKCSVHAPGRVAWGGLSSLTLIALGLVWRRRRIA